MAKASAEAGSTHYVAEGEPVPGDLPDGVRLVGPGAPGEAAAEPDAAGSALVTVAEQRAAGVPPEETVTIADQKTGTPPPFPGSTPEPSSPGSSAPGDGLLLAELTELCRERGLPVYGTKADLAARLAAYDEDHPEA